jgi:hypothetical protein
MCWSARKLRVRSARAGEAHALDQGGRALAEGERLLGEEVDRVEAGDLVLAM